MASDVWDPLQYRRFEAERRQPFDDLRRLLRAVPGGRVVDVGCGTGALTAELHQSSGAAETLGVDSSPAMLAEAAALRVPGLSFRLGDAAQMEGSGFDLVFANASLQWVPDHLRLVPRLREALAPGGQLAFQVPANFDHPSHLLARDVAAEPRFASALAAADPIPEVPVLAPERYAELLDDLGCIGQHVRLQVYGHHLESSDAVVEWVRGTLLTRYRSRLPPGEYDAFVDRYRALLVQRLGPAQPYFYAFKRILAWAEFP